MVYISADTYTPSISIVQLLNCMNFDEIFMHYLPNQPTA